MKQLYLVTGNKNKLAEWRGILPPDISLDMADIDLPEIQSDDPLEIVTDKARRAYKLFNKPVVVEDSEAGLDKLNGLPGPFIKFFLKRLGDNALYILAGSDGERGYMACSIAYYDGEQMITAIGKVTGVIVSARGENGFGFDQTLIPDGESLTLAEMDPSHKNSVSHRSLAIRLLLENLRESQPIED